MNKALLLCIAATFVCSISFATIRRVGYWGTAITNVDFATGELAVTASSNGDTILVYPSSNTWSFSNLNKRLVIIGTGYYHYPGANGVTNYNAGLQNLQPSTICYFYFYPGCDSSIITGCEFYAYTQGTADIKNVKVTNCRVSYIYFDQPYTYDGWEVSKCELISTGIYGYNNSKITNLKMFNCVVDGGYGIYTLSTTPGQTGIIENCTFISSGMNLQNQGFLIQNCILYSSIANYSNTVFNNNIFVAVPSPAVSGANNITGVSYTTLFIGYPTQGTYSNDERFKLKPGSAALGAGINGVDCGAFGGVNPYKLSGIPAIPAFYKLTAPSSAASANPYTITFSVRSNN